jgi:hypothetical protein
MEHAATAPSRPASPHDPQPDRPSRTMPARIAALLHTVRIMLGFGRHLAETARRRSASPDFNAIAVCFGTGRLSAILAHLQRGLLRAAALERVLLARAARGREIQFVAPHEHATATPPVLADPAAGQSADPAAGQSIDSPAGQPADALSGQPADAPAGEPADLSAGQPAEAPVARQAAAPPSRPRGWNDPELFMPTPEDFEAQVRRRSFGRTLVDICLDLAVVPGFCSGPFWNELFDSIRLHGGSIGTLMQEKMRRQEAFCAEQDRKPGSNWDWLTMGRDAFRRMLGFFIGEVADDSFDPISQHNPPAAAIATGPP